MKLEIIGLVVWISMGIVINILFDEPLTYFLIALWWLTYLYLQIIFEGSFYTVWKDAIKEYKDSKNFHNEG